jgi:hypothetical protein
MSESVKIHAADVDDQDIQAQYIEIEDDEAVPGHVLVSISDDRGVAYDIGYMGIYLEPADARTLAQTLIDYANKVEY